MNDQRSFALLQHYTTQYHYLASQDAGRIVGAVYVKPMEAAYWLKGLMPDRPVEWDAALGAAIEARRAEYAEVQP